MTLYLRVASFVWTHRRLALVGALVVALAGAFVLGRRSVKPVTLVSEKIIERVEKVPYGVPQPYIVTLPGTVERVPVTIERIREIFRDVPRDVVRVVTPPVLCRTDEECRRIYGQSEQRITVDAALRAGTVVPVTVNGQEAQYPLSRDFPFQIKLVLSDRGVFHALDNPLLPVKPISVTTETVVLRPTVVGLPYHLALVAGTLGPVRYAGLEYQNRIGPAIYRVTVAHEFPGMVYGLSVILPLR